MSPFRSRWLVVTCTMILLTIPSVTWACLWDADTIKTERLRFPSTLELITGKFLRHSPEFYEWRIKDRLKRLESDPNNVKLLDDLAVAYDKTGQHEKAIETALKIEQISYGRYETAANLGTFYLHTGNFKECLPHIERAIKINPDAHFGREIYQKKLVEYVIRNRNENPNAIIQPWFGLPHNRSYPSILAGPLLDKSLASEKQLPNAIKGVLGMMRFNNHNLPILLEALGYLLIKDTDRDIDAKLMASRAFLKASYETKVPENKIAYRDLAEAALRGKIPQERDQGHEKSIDWLESEFQKELQEAETWYAELREKELSWIRDGKDPEAEFDKLYDEEPNLSGTTGIERFTAQPIENLIIYTVVAVVCVLVFVGIPYYLVCRRGRRNS